MVSSRFDAIAILLALSGIASAAVHGSSPTTSSTRSSLPLPTSSLPLTTSNESSRPELSSPSLITSELSLSSPSKTSISSSSSTFFTSSVTSSSHASSATPDSSPGSSAATTASNAATTGIGDYILLGINPSGSTSSASKHSSSSTHTASSGAAAASTASLPQATAASSPSSPVSSPSVTSTVRLYSSAWYSQCPQMTLGDYVAPIIHGDPDSAEYATSCNEALLAYTRSRQSYNDAVVYQTTITSSWMIPWVYNSWHKTITTAIPTFTLCDGFPRINTTSFHIYEYLTLTSTAATTSITTNGRFKPSCIFTSQGGVFFPTAAPSCSIPASQCTALWKDWAKTGNVDELNSNNYLYTGTVSVPQCATASIPYFQCDKEVDAHSSTSINCNTDRGRCTVMADTAQVYFWPPTSTASGDGLCATTSGAAAAPTITSPAVIRMQVVDVGSGRLVTMTSPSAYIAFNKVSAQVNFGHGPQPDYSTFVNKVLEMDPAQMSTIEIHPAGFQGSWQDEISYALSADYRTLAWTNLVRPLDFAHLAATQPPASNYFFGKNEGWWMQQAAYSWQWAYQQLHISTQPHIGTIVENYHAAISIPPQLLEWDPRFRSCFLDFDGAFDPPSVLTGVEVVASATFPAFTTSPSPSPLTTSTPQPTVTPSAGSPITTTQPAQTSVQTAADVTTSTSSSAAVVQNPNTSTVLPATEIPASPTNPTTSPSQVQDAALSIPTSAHTLPEVLTSTSSSAIVVPDPITFTVPIATQLSASPTTTTTSTSQALDAALSQILSTPTAVTSILSNGAVESGASATSPSVQRTEVSAAPSSSPSSPSADAADPTLSGAEQSALSPSKEPASAVAQPTVPSSPAATSANFVYAPLSSGGSSLNNNDVPIGAASAATTAAPDIPTPTTTAVFITLPGPSDGLSAPATTAVQLIAGDVTVTLPLGFSTVLPGPTPQNVAITSLGGSDVLVLGSQTLSIGSVTTTSTPAAILPPTGATALAVLLPGPAAGTTSPAAAVTAYEVITSNSANDHAITQFLLISGSGVNGTATLTAGLSTTVGAHMVAVVGGQLVVDGTTVPVRVAAATTSSNSSSSSIISSRPKKFSSASVLAPSRSSSSLAASTGTSTSSSGTTESEGTVHGVPTARPPPVVQLASDARRIPAGRSVWAVIMFAVLFVVHGRQALSLAW